MPRYEHIPARGDEYASPMLRAAVTLTRWGSVVSYLSERRDGSTRAYVAEAPVAIDSALDASWRRSGFARVGEGDIVEIPRLEMLDLCLGWPREGTEALADVDDFQALFAAKGVPALRSLALRHTKISEALCDALARSPLAAQLESLDMSKGSWTTEGAKRLADARRAFPRLRTLDVSGSGLGAEGRTLLEGAYAEVKCRPYYYPSWFYKGHPEDPATKGS